MSSGPSLCLPMPTLLRQRSATHLHLSLQNYKQKNTIKIKTKMYWWCSYTYTLYCLAFFPKDLSGLDIKLQTPPSKTFGKASKEKKLSLEGEAVCKVCSFLMCTYNVKTFQVGRAKYHIHAITFKGCFTDGWVKWVLSSCPMHKSPVKFTLAIFALSFHNTKTDFAMT